MSPAQAFLYIVLFLAGCFIVAVVVNYRGITTHIKNIFDPPPPPPKDNGAEPDEDDGAVSADQNYVKVGASWRSRWGNRYGSQQITSRRDGGCPSYCSLSRYKNYSTCKGCYKPKLASINKNKVAYYRTNTSKPVRTTMDLRRYSQGGGSRYSNQVYRPRAFSKQWKWASWL